MRLLGFEFKSDDIKMAKAMEFIVKKILPDYKYKRIALVVKKMKRAKIQALETKQNRLILLSNCSVCGKKN